MRLVVFRHSQDWQLSDRPLLALDATSSLVNCGQICIEVSRIATSARYLFPSCRDLTQSFTVIGHIGKDDQNVHSEFESQIFGSGQCKTRSRYALDDRIICQVHEQNRLVDCTTLAKIRYKIVGFLECDAHRAKNDGELVSSGKHPSLPGNMRGDLGVRKTTARKDRQLLTPNKSIESVDCRNASLYELVGIVARIRIHGIAIDVQHFLRENRSNSIDRCSESVEHPAHDVARDPELQPVSKESSHCLTAVHSRRTLEDLNQDSATGDLKYLAVSQSRDRTQFDEFTIFDILSPIQKYKRPHDFADCSVILIHGTPPVQSCPFLTEPQNPFLSSSQAYRMQQDSSRKCPLSERFRF